MELPPSEWYVFENKHDPIIDKETFEIAQKLCTGRRKPSKVKDPGPLNGLLYCSDCGHRMHMSQAQTRPRSCHYFICSKYRTDHRPVSCTAHRIQIDNIEELAARELRAVIGLALNNREEFIAKVMQNSSKAAEQKLKKARKECDAAESRIAALDKIISRLYEDNLIGKISDERFSKMSADYEKEQAELRTSFTQLKNEVISMQTQNEKSDSFLRLVDQYSEFETLTPEIARTFFEKIIIYEGEKNHYGRIINRRVDFVFNYIGQFPKDI
jgi:hypothetical protein